MVTRLPVLCVAIDIELTTVAGNNYMIRDFLSHHWVNNFLFKGKILQEARVSIFENYVMEDLMTDNIVKIFDTVNAGGGWTGIGWPKLGKVQDKATGVATANAYNAAQPVLVSSGTVLYHLVSLVPSEPKNHNLVVMEEFKVDVNEINEMNE